MRIIFSRKGFDSAAGGGPSPIVGGRPISLPIPASGASQTTYGDLGLSQYAARASRGKLGEHDMCHHDPMFLEGRSEVLLGQCGAAQTHLQRHGVGKGDVFLFFGLFRHEEDTGSKHNHHRIFGFLEVEELLGLHKADEQELAALRALKFPHALGNYASNDALYRGRGAFASQASELLKLTAPEGTPSLWEVPPFLFETGLSYHGREDRWRANNRLQSVARGQEFIADIGSRNDARQWLESIKAAIEF